MEMRYTVSQLYLAEENTIIAEGHDADWAIENPHDAIRRYGLMRGDHLEHRVVEISQDVENVASWSHSFQGTTREQFSNRSDRTLSLTTYRVVKGKNARFIRT